MKCYLCDHEAKRKDIGMAKELVDCPECGRYSITFHALHFYFDPKKQNLTKEDKKKLSEHVKEHYDAEKDEPIPLDMKTTERITGKRSENIRYK